MNDHIPDPTKMISDTPRTDAVYFKQGATMYDLANEMKLVERELNAANQRIKRLEEDSQRLNWLLNRGLAWRDCYNDWWKEGEWLYASQSALQTIDKAKEAKL